MVDVEDERGYFDEDEPSYFHADSPAQEAGASSESESEALPRAPQRRGGRFASAGPSGSSKRSRGVDDESWIVTESVPGGPVDGSVIPNFLGHVASRMWTGEMRGILKCQNRYGVMQRVREWYGRMSVEAKQMIDGTGLSHLQYTMFDHLDTPLISAFVERWQPDTSSFHMPFGEMTIMLHDVWQIMRIPVDGDMISADPDSDQLQALCMEMLGVQRNELLVSHWSGGGINNQSVLSLAQSQLSPGDDAKAWLWILLGSTLFVDKSGNKFRPHCLYELIDSLDTVPDFSWGSATLAYLYRHLGMASRGDCQGIAGCLTLLQAWIYEYFHCFRPHQGPMMHDTELPRVMA